MPQAQLAIDPRFMDFPAWANTMRVQNPDLPEGTPESQWQAWAAQARQYEPNVPNPRYFADWRGWAQAWLRAL